MKKIHITTLGCPKNLVDSEVLMGQLETNHYEISDEPENSDVIIINTCGFIEDAKNESIQAIFEALKLKENDPAKKVFVAGCLSQRYRKEIEKEIPEVDAIFGTEDYESILKSLGKQHSALDNIYRMRKLSTPRHYAYLKISEGCNHTCSFCAIPGIRGKHRSRTIESLVDEASKLADRGAKELILISQDTSYYGRDIYGQQKIVELIEQLQRIDSLEWIRVLYWYPTNFPIGVLDLMKNGGKLLPYIDMPIQHISENMLRKMRRGDTRESLVGLFAKIRSEIPEIALRTTMILGHPGEKEADFNELKNFVKDIQFDRLGTFLYSDEDGTPAFDLDEKVDKRIAEERQAEIMEIQRNISLEKNNSYINHKYKVLIDEIDSTAGIMTGRTYRDTPEIDNEVIITTENTDNFSTGSFVNVLINDASEYELYGRISVNNK
ncbi:MAG: 30S ribosomal protein S12 methylthiotransferase RimO [Calditrichaceae bacterium]